MEHDFSAVVVGGGAAGLTAALVLGRARVPTLVVDDGRQSNRPAHAVGGLLGHSSSPAALYEAGRNQLAELPAVTIADTRVTAACGTVDAFTVELADRPPVTARRLLLAAGMDYVLPDVPGLAELWGDTVFHCPYCHGWEVAGLPLAVLGTLVHQPLLLTAWSDDIVLFTDGAEPAPDDAALLAAAGIRVDRRPVTGVRAVDGRLAAVCLGDGAEVERAGLLVATPLRPRSPLADGLGVDRAAWGGIAVDGMGRTSVPGVFAAGDVINQRPNITAALADGTRAATALHHSLLHADIGMPLLL